MVKPTKPIIHSNKEYRAYLGEDLVQIGDEETVFKPSMMLSRWRNEAKLKISFDDSAIVTKRHRLISGKVKWESPQIDIHIYPLDPTIQYEHGGMEYEVILKSKPATNIITLQIESENLRFFHQGKLSQEEIDFGAKRPDNVVGSYAVYHATKRDNQYKTGKAFHIYRPKAIDANGWEVWGDLHIENGLMTITLPQDFIDKAKYPIRHASGATFGKTDVGGTPSASLSTIAAGTNYQSSVAGTLVRISVYCQTSNADDVRVAMYNLVANNQTAAPDDPLFASAKAAIAIPAWNDFAAGGEIITANTWYNIAFRAENLNTNFAFDAGDADSEKLDNTYTVIDDAWHDPWVVTTSRNLQWSIHADYTLTGSADLLGEFSVRHAGSADLLGEFSVRQAASEDLLGIFSVSLTSASEDLLGEFDVRQEGSVDLLGEFDVQHEATAELLGEFFVRHIGTPLNLFGGFVVRHEASVDLLGEFIVQHEATAELLGELYVGHSSSVDLAAEFLVRNTGTANLSCEFNVRQETSVNLLAEFIVRHIGVPVELLAEFSIRHPDSEELLGVFDVRQETSEDLLGVFDVRQEVSVDLLGEFITRQAAIRDLPAEFEVGQNAVNLLGEFFVLNAGTAELLAEFVVRHTATVDLAAEFIVQHASSADLPASIWINYYILNLPAKFYVRQTSLRATDFTIIDNTRGLTIHDADREMTVTPKRRMRVK